MSTHVTVSHGSDFHGVDILPVRQLREFGQHVRSVLPADDHPPLARLLDDAGESEHAIDTDQAALLAVLLRCTAAHRRLKSFWATGWLRDDLRGVDRHPGRAPRRRRPLRPR